MGALLDGRTHNSSDSADSASSGAFPAIERLERELRESAHRRAKFLSHRRGIGLAPSPESRRSPHGCTVASVPMLKPGDLCPGLDGLMVLAEGATDGVRS